MRIFTQNFQIFIENFLYTPYSSEQNSNSIVYVLMEITMKKIF